MYESFIRTKFSEERFQNSLIYITSPHSESNLRGKKRQLDHIQTAFSVLSYCKRDSISLRVRFARSIKLRIQQLIECINLFRFYFWNRIKIVIYSRKYSLLLLSIIQNNFHIQLKSVLH